MILSDNYFVYVFYHLIHDCTNIYITYVVQLFSIIYWCWPKFEGSIKKYYIASIEAIL